MKNHIKVDGKLLQTNKKWSQLKEQQKSWIFETTAREWTMYVEKNGKLPMKKNKESILDAVHAKLLERDIWIPYGEFKQAVSKKIDRLNHKSPLFKPPERKAPEKPKIPKQGYETFPAEVQEDTRAVLEKFTASYISQAHRLPSAKVRDSHIKQVLRRFNAKRWKEYGIQIQSTDALLLAYEEIRQRLYSEHCRNRQIPLSVAKAKRNTLATQDVVLETDRLLLRKLTTKDWKAVREMLSDPEVMAAWERTFPTKRDNLDWIIRQMRRYDKDLVGYFAAIEKNSGIMAGQIGLMWNDISGHRRLEVGYILRRDRWGLGYASEGAAACISHGFSLFDADKIYATIRPENTASIKVAERLGMAREGSFVKTYEGKRMEHLIYSIKNPE